MLSTNRYPEVPTRKQNSLGFRISSLTTVNDVPTISDVSSLSTNEDAATGALAVTLGDVETAVTDMCLCGRSG